jgi:hypothetical protein
MKKIFLILFIVIYIILLLLIDKNKMLVGYLLTIDFVIIFLLLINIQKIK